MGKKLRGTDGGRAYTLHRGRYGQPPESVVRFESDGKFFRVTFGQLSDGERAWLDEVLPHMHGTAAWGETGGGVGPVRVLVDA